MCRMTTVASLILAISLAACSGIETRPADTQKFAAGNFTYYKWRTPPLANPTGSKDPLYLMDPMIRREVDKQLQAKGYVHDATKAQFSVDYLQAMGLREGVPSQDASLISGVDPIPSARPNRQINQAMVDNAQALSGVQETSNIALQFNATATNEEVWRVVITKIVENTNEIDRSEMKEAIKRGIEQGLETLPAAR